MFSDFNCFVVLVLLVCFRWGGLVGFGWIFFVWLVQFCFFQLFLLFSQDFALSQLKILCSSLTKTKYKTYINQNPNTVSIFSVLISLKRVRNFTLYLLS